jgi:hypothetical protein
MSSLHITFKNWHLNRRDRAHTTIDMPSSVQQLHRILQTEFREYTWPDEYQVFFKKNNVHIQLKTTDDLKYVMRHDAAIIVVNLDPC